MLLSHGIAELLDVIMRLFICHIVISSIHKCLSDQFNKIPKRNAIKNFPEPEGSSACWKDAITGPCSEQVVIP